MFNLLSLYFYNHIILTLIHQLQYNIIHTHTHTHTQATELTERARGEANAHKESLEDALRTIRRLENVIKELDAQKDSVEMKLDSQAEVVAKLKQEKQNSRSNVISHQKQLEASSRPSQP